GWVGVAVTGIAVVMTLFHLYAAYDIVPTQELRYIHVAFVLLLSFLLFPLAGMSFSAAFSLCSCLKRRAGQPGRSCRSWRFCSSRTRCSDLICRRRGRTAASTLRALSAICSSLSKGFSALRST